MRILPAGVLLGKLFKNFPSRWVRLVVVNQTDIVACQLGGIHCQKVLSVGLILRTRVFDLQDAVADLDGQSVLQIKNARLTRVFESRARLTDLCSSKAHSLPGTPAKHGEGLQTNLAVLSIVVLGHAQIGIVPQTALAQNWKLLHARERGRVQVQEYVPTIPTAAFRSIS